MSDPRGPSAYTIERCVAAWQRVRAEVAADQALIGDEAAIVAALETTGETTPDVLLDRLMQALTFAELRSTEAAWLIAEAQSRKHRYDRRVAMLRETVTEMLLAIERKTISTPYGTATVRAGVDRAMVLDVNMLPPGYVTTEVVKHPDLRALKEDLQQGVIIPGAILSNGAPSLQVRRDKPLRAALEDSTP